MKPFRAFLASFAIGLTTISTGYGLMADMFVPTPDVQIGPIGPIGDVNA